MKIKRIILFGIAFTLCGNTFAYSPYADTITNNLPKKSFLTAMSFPTTAADATFVERVENKRAGYEPYFNRSAFAGMTIEEQDELESMAYRAELQRINMFNTTPLYIYCESYPDASECSGIQTQTPNEPATTITPNTSHTQPVPPTQPNFIIQPTNENALYMSAALTPENVARYNLSTHDGGCTPPEFSKWGSNKIETSGQYQYIAPAFEKFMITAFRKEGGCVNDPNDRGGYTCYGCASNGLCRGIDMATITRAMVENLTYNNMFQPNNVAQLPDAFRGYAMWGIWGSGERTGIKLFQRALGIPETKRIDDATIKAAEEFKGDFADAYVRTHEQFYRDIVATDPTQKKFLKGWLNSLELLRPSGCHVVPTNPIYR